MTKLFIIMKIIMLISLSIISILLNSIPSHNKLIHPVIMGLILLNISILCSMNSSLTNNNHWFSYLMFLIIIGGMMIIFLYFTSFISNMKTSMKWSFIINIPLKFFFIIIFIIYFMFNFNKYLFWLSEFSEIKSLMLNMKILMNNNNMQIMYMYMYNKNFSTIISMIYLLICLTFIVKMCINKKMMLRKTN
uniref:NADH dehydrogenase subunit 6 n=1 Tax=Necremnus tutae TaxID=1615824 RepID=A0A7S6R176_9HYME|nr:NADH dehydrogenase subunit 6 [Necremnus tutae]QOV03002.1 NADH dehydrogenase subunit 6 [Necremnus tutae]